MEEKDIIDGKVFMDKSGASWTYVSYSKSNLIEEKMMEKYGSSVSFIETHDGIMTKYAERGDTLPIILMNEDLTEGVFSFMRGGKVVSIKMNNIGKYGIWTYKPL
ncbi:hypothetical protein ACI7RC_15915 [Brevibacillus sp. B_LB10_24]|uniref:hypothetical protein n=1 Tax=Brevibacillus sp. B_LB10_24 TaxID=3380645 RepID=UPI0038B8DC72